MTVDTDIEVFLTTFGEAVTYVPRSGDERGILAIVDRETAVVDARVARPQIRVTVANRATSTDDDEIGGIGSTEINAGGDGVRLARRVGDAAELLTITEITEQDGEMMELLVG